MENGSYIGRYLWEDKCGLKKDHIYKVNIIHELYGYYITAIVDFTEEEVCDHCMVCASEQSIKRYWELE